MTRGGDVGVRGDDDSAVQMVVDRVVFVAVLALPAAFLWAAPRMRHGSPEEIAAVVRTVNWILGGVLGAFSLAALLRKGQGNARLTAWGCLVLSVGGLGALREIARRAAFSQALERAGREVRLGDPALVTPMRWITIGLALAAAFLFIKAGRAGAWSATFAFAGAMLAADVALLSLFVRATIG